MVGRIIRAFGRLYYDHPTVAKDIVATGPFAKLKIAVVADHFTTECLAMECSIRQVTPANYREVIDSWKPDLLFVESAFHGMQGTWRYELAKQPRWLRLTRPKAIFRVVEHARARRVPTVFWNKDDGAYFDEFIHVAKAFDAVFTTDEDCLQRYRQALPSGVPAQVLMMPYQPRLHAFEGFAFRHRAACFLGSYYQRILNDRRSFLDMMFAAMARTQTPLYVYDRNHGRLSSFREFSFPKHSHVHVRAKVSHARTARVYKSHEISLNVNSVTGSRTMISRRLVEILACGGIAVTNGSRAVSEHFKDFCHVIETADQALELLSRLKHGPSADDLQRAEAGAGYVRQHHTWAHRLEQVCATIGAGS